MSALFETLYDLGLVVLVCLVSLRVEKVYRLLKDREGER